jgi:hypothetical protein
MYFICIYYVLKNVLKWYAFTAASVHSSKPIQVSQQKTPTKVIKGRATKGKEKSPWRVLTSSPVIQKMTLKAKHRNKNSAWFTVHTRAIPVKMMTVTAVSNVRSTAV